MSDWIADPTSQRTYEVRVRRGSDGGFVATCDDPTCLARGRSEDEALAKIRNEIRFRVELCPCTGVGDDHVQLAVTRS